MKKYGYKKGIFYFFFFLCCCWRRVGKNEGSGIRYKHPRSAKMKYLINFVIKCRYSPLHSAHQIRYGSIFHFPVMKSTCRKYKIPSSSKYLLTLFWETIHYGILQALNTVGPANIKIKVPLIRLHEFCRNLKFFKLMLFWKNWSDLPFSIHLCQFLKAKSKSFS